MGGLLPDCGSRGRLDLGLDDCLPCPVCLADEPKAEITTAVPVSPGKEHARFKADLGTTSVDVKVLKGRQQWSTPMQCEGRL